MTKKKQTRWKACLYASVTYHLTKREAIDDAEIIVEKVSGYQCPCCDKFWEEANVEELDKCCDLKKWEDKLERRKGHIESNILNEKIIEYMERRVALIKDYLENKGGK